MYAFLITNFAYIDDETEQLNENNENETNLKGNTYLLLGHSVKTD